MHRTVVAHGTVRSALGGTALAHGCDLPTAICDALYCGVFVCGTENPYAAMRCAVRWYAARGTESESVGQDGELDD
eukprot:1277419-Rhodomonas_salina.1